MNKEIKERLIEKAFKHPNWKLESFYDKFRKDLIRKYMDADFRLSSRGKGKRAANALARKFNKVLNIIVTVNDALNERPELRESMLKQLEEYHKMGERNATDKNNRTWLDASERAIVLLGGDLIKKYGKDTQKRLDDLVKIKDSKTNVIHKEIFNKVMKLHDVPNDFLTDPLKWEAKRRSIKDQMKVAAPS